MTTKPSDQRDRLIGRLDVFIKAADEQPQHEVHSMPILTLIRDVRAYLLSQTYWPQGVGKPKRDYSGDWKRRLR